VYGRVRGAPVVVCLLVSVIAGGCASHHGPASTNRFVKQGKPLIEMGKPVPVAKGSPKAPHQPVPKLRPASSATLPTVEASDPALAAALRAASLAATPAAHRRVADRYRELGILDMAHDHYLSASQLDRTDASAYEGLARVWRDWGFAQLGLADASRAVYYAPSSASAHNTLGTVLAAVGHGDEARREYERSVQLDPGAAYAMSNLCYLSFLQGNTQQAAAECRAALAIDPALASARSTLASLDRRATRDSVR
jgi:tetratricopeptide (TPR) repeat protein